MGKILRLRRRSPKTPDWLHRKRKGWQSARLLVLALMAGGAAGWVAFDLWPAAAGLFPPVSAGQADIAGPVRVIDGDTLDIGDVTIRLHGIDAPESKQACEREGVTWLCGAEATATLLRIVKNATVTCQERDRDRYGRTVAVCFAGEHDINAAMVAAGMALAYRRYSEDYTGAEASAQAARTGLWAGRFVEPWEWRRGKRLQTAAANYNQAGDCRIKGNISRSGERIYHTPGQQYYSRTKIAESKGERWFCSEAEARAAGWRHSRR